MNSDEDDEQKQLALPQLRGKPERASRRVIREQDRWLPIANVSRVMRGALPEYGKLSREATECMQECVSEFISFITSQAAEKCSIERRKTLNGEDILFSMYSLGFENYAETLKIYLAKYREYELDESERRRQKYRARKEKKRLEKLALEEAQQGSRDGDEGVADQGVADQDDDDDDSVLYDLPDSDVAGLHLQDDDGQETNNTDGGAAGGGDPENVTGNGDELFDLMGKSDGKRDTDTDIDKEADIAAEADAVRRDFSGDINDLFD